MYRLKNRTIHGHCFDTTNCKGQIPLRYPAREPACELVRELDSVMEFGLMQTVILTLSVV